jgi:hypothetical protein
VCRRLRQGNHAFKVSLCYIAGSRPAFTTYGDPNSKKRKGEIEIFCTNRFPNQFNSLVSNIVLYSLLEFILR